MAAVAAMAVVVAAEVRVVGVADLGSMVRTISSSNSSSRGSSMARLVALSLRRATTAGENKGSHACCQACQHHLHMLPCLQMHRNCCASAQFADTHCSCLAATAPPTAATSQVQRAGAGARGGGTMPAGVAAPGPTLRRC